jgi:hypothetical protein
MVASTVLFDRRTSNQLVRGREQGFQQARAPEGRLPPQNRNRRDRQRDLQPEPA